MKTIWPEQFTALKEVAEVPIKKAVVPVKAAKVKSQLESVCGPARAAPDLGQHSSQRMQPSPACPEPPKTADPVTASTALPERRKLPPPPTGNVT